MAFASQFLYYVLLFVEDIVVDDETSPVETQPERDEMVQVGLQVK